MPRIFFISAGQRDQKDNPLLLDCAGGCWGCIGQIEEDMGYEYFLPNVKEEFAKGLR